MTRTLLVGPAGVGLSDVVTRFTRSAGSTTDVEDLEVFYVEHDLLATTDWLSPQFPFTATRNMRDLLLGITRRELMELWTAALERCVERADASSAPHTVIAFHPSLYAFSRNEQYSTVGWALASGRLTGISRVVLLIDDVYDMWERLAVDKGALFHHAEWLRRRLEAQKLDDLIVFDGAGSATPKVDSADTFDGLVMDSAHAILGRLLAWRHLDMVEAESLASTLGAPLTALGVKHPFDALRTLIVKPATATAYLSHPISRPRRARRSGSEWPAVVTESNELSPKFSELDVVLVCPTAIDEFRLEQPTERQAIFSRPFELGERWPPLVHQDDAISAAAHPSDRLTHIPLVSRSSLTAGATARSIETEIYAEVPFRDHYLVTHTSSFFVFRPLYEEGEFSGGVRAEIAHWQQLANFESGRRALFVHAEEDVRLIEAHLDEQPLRERIRSRMRDYLKRRGLPEENIEDLLSGRPLRSDMLAADTPSSAVLNQLLDDARDHAGKDLFFAALTALAPESWLQDERVTLSVLRSSAPSRNELQEYAGFLKGESSLDHNGDYFREIERTIGATMSEWIERRMDA